MPGWVAPCPTCGRRTGVTFGRRALTNGATIRPHGPRANPCPGSDREVDNDTVRPK